MTFEDLDYQVYRIRRIESEISRHYGEQEMRCPVHLSIGQEYQAVGVGSALETSDLMVSTHRGHAHYLAKGGNLRALLAELYGKKEGCSGGYGGSMHLVDWSCGFAGSTSIVGGTIPIGVGLAFAEKYKKTNNIVAVCIGDAAVEEGVFHESANFASLHNLPVLFVCENNQYSCYTHINERQAKRPLKKIAEAHHLEYRGLEEPNVRGIYGLTQEIVRQMREGAGPFFLELQTFRLVEHCGPNEDDHLNYRDPDEVAKWQIHDANQMKNLKLSRQEKMQIEAEIGDAFQHVKLL